MPVMSHPLLTLPYVSQIVRFIPISMHCDCPKIHVISYLFVFRRNNP